MAKGTAVEDMRRSKGGAKTKAEEAAGSLCSTASHQPKSSGCRKASAIARTDKCDKMISPKAENYTVVFFQTYYL